MESLNQIFLQITYVFLLIWGVVKIRNLLLIKKLDCKDTYKSVKKEIKEQKIIKYLSKILVICTSIIGIYILIGLFAGGLSFFFTFGKIGGVAVMDMELNRTIYNFLLSIAIRHFTLIKEAFYFEYIIIYLFLIRDIIISVLSYKRLCNFK